MTEDSYLVPDLKNNEIHRTEITVKKSRFITSIGRTHGVDEAKAFIERICNEFPDARHNCFAYNADKPGSSGYAGCSDDGEPHGTAGQPMLNVVLHCNVGELTVVVTRYFGGILLGTGGLVKAYQDSVKTALETLPTTPMVIVKKCSFQVGHSEVNLVLRLFSRLGVTILNQSYTDKVDYLVEIPEKAVEAFRAEITKITSGQSVLTFPD